jgi:protein NrfC
MNSALTRRKFLKCSGLVIFSLGAGRYVVAGTRGVTQIPPAEGYLVVDGLKCQGCLSCMLACSLVHEGRESLSLSRIQVCQNPFEKFPYDLGLFQCRQCTAPACVDACPEGALTADAGAGGVRRVNRDKCTGCGACVDACPFHPKRVVVQPDTASKHGAMSRKCDLCARAPFHWDETGGGPDGKQACVEICPVNAIAFTREIPVQTGHAGYQVNLRDDNWYSLGYGDIKRGE